jgi:hypothetical protein
MCHRSSSTTSTVAAEILRARALPTCSQNVFPPRLICAVLARNTLLVILLLYAHIEAMRQPVEKDAGCKT